jgi:hypothetical protein
MRTIQDMVLITFTDGSNSQSIVLNDGIIVLVDSNDLGEITAGATPLDCTLDKLFFLTDFTVVDYFITSSSGYEMITPTILQYLPGCPVTCTLDENGSNGIISTSIFNVSP